ncbi:MAG: type II toxin-antitoxin system Phd/YefM family antitoxin [Chloroflexi bacterium]|nr:type II toxin-antitoxin system Phd/YefM family antitoxin [Chloroflexota bacterium]MBA3797448.1 type II toxin-antitoxin system Phd/YefM family antitoxin [Chloroflexota bacterium]
MSVTDARDDFAELVNRVAYGKDRVIVSRRGRELAAIVPVSDVALLELLDDELDLMAARAALADPANSEALDWKDVRGELD